MIVYSSTKNNFISDVNDSSIDVIMKQTFESVLNRTVGESEISSWRDSLPYMAQVLSTDKIPNNAGVLIEYNIPTSNFRVDFIITGLGAEDSENIVIVELKRWQAIEKTDKNDIVKTRFKGGLQETTHPSYQAWSYAAYLNSFNKAIYDGGINLYPCAYLHNYISDGIINNTFYNEYIKLAPLFLKDDKENLRNYIIQKIKKGDNTSIMKRVESSELKPSKQLAECVASMISNNQEFIMIDNQKLVYETALNGVKKSTSTNKNVLIVEGGPGTGKSVVAINLLAKLTSLRKTVRYVTKNAAPREIYKSKLTGSLRGRDIDFLFAGSGSFINNEANQYNALIVDEAHRLNLMSGLYANLGENQIKEIINSAHFTVFFIDEDQQVTINDIGTKDEIIKWAKHFGAGVRELVLDSQFRCNGSNGYLAWLDNTLQIRDTANPILSSSEYNFNIVDSPEEMRDFIYSANNLNNKSRMVAGYCWNWISKKDPSKFDIVLSSSFRHQWNLTKHGSKWLIEPDSVSEIGCIHTCQGLELDYVGVIIGNDLIVRNGKVITDHRNRATSDRALYGIRNLALKDPEGAANLADRIIKNTYRTLLTRGMKGAYVYFTDDETRDFFRSRIVD